jgi:hypothetical protein
MRIFASGRATGTIDDPPTTGPTAQPDTGAPMGRRRFLRIAGLAVGTAAVAGATGITWKAVDGGVFATGTGPAYAAAVVLA